MIKQSFVNGVLCNHFIWKTNERAEENLENEKNV